MAIITLAQVKTYTTLTDADDAAITAMIPVIDSKVKLITNHNWNWQVLAKTVLDSPNVEIFESYNYAGIGIDHSDRGINAPYVFRNIGEYLEAGSTVSGNGIPAGAYILDVYADGASYNNLNIPFVTLSDNATATSDSVQLFIGMPLAYIPTVAKGVQWLIEQSSKGSGSAQGGIQSKRMGPVSVTYADKDADIDGMCGMPGWFVKALPRYGRGL